MYTPCWGLLDAIVCRMAPASMGLHRCPWYESVDQEETRAKEAGMPCRWVCGDGPDLAKARAEPELQLSCLGGNTAEENCCEVQPVLPMSLQSQAH